MQTLHLGSAWRPALIWTACFAVAPPLLARQATQMATVKPPAPDMVRAAYSGFIEWKNSSTDAEGTATETVRASVVAGIVDCNVGYVAPGHSGNASGRGLFDLYLGLKPDPPKKGEVPAKAAYSFKIACPDPEYTDRVREARWSHMMDSYRQPGGEIGTDRKTGQLVLPDKLEGSRTEQFNDGNGGTSSSTLTWKLCTTGNANACKTPPPLPPPPPPPSPPAGGR